ncbi:heme-binding protein [Alcaligenaceae bacterium C4P045]|nr:heme-binding protein [Alcaligenaceae bacterium C4P045]
MIYPKSISRALSAMTLLTSITLSANALAAPAAAAVEPRLSLARAQQVVRAAQAKAEQEGWPGVISVADSSGLPILTLRMDNAAVPAGVELAPAKARTAALFRRPSADLENAVNGARPALGTARGFVLLRGGLPISMGGQIVGAIGVSADTPDHDEAIAAAGVSALR